MTEAQDTLLPPPPEGTRPAPLATLVTSEGRLVRLVREADGALTLDVERLAAPLSFDRFQSIALVAAVKEAG